MAKDEPILIVLAAPSTFALVTVVLSKLNVVEELVIVPPLTSTLPINLKFELLILVKPESVTVDPRVEVLRTEVPLIKNDFALAIFTPPAKKVVLFADPT